MVELFTLVNKNVIMLQLVMDVIKVEPESDKNMQMGSDVEEEEDLGCSSLKTEGGLQPLFSGTCEFIRRYMFDTHCHNNIIATCHPKYA
jgi:hypothetical protein